MSKLQYIADRLEAGLAARNNGHLVDERKVIWSGNGDYSKVLSHTGFCVIKECLEGDLLSISKKAGYVTVLDNCLYYFYEKMYVWFFLHTTIHTVMYTILCTSTYCPHQIQLTACTSQDTFDLSFIKEAAAWLSSRFRDITGPTEGPKFMAHDRCKVV